MNFLGQFGPLGRLTPQSAYAVVMIYNDSIDTIQKTSKLYNRKTHQVPVYQVSYVFFFLDCINGDIPRPYNMLLLRQGAALISFDLIKCILKKILIICFLLFY
jgi:hypothetical protein